MSFWKGYAFPNEDNFQIFFYTLLGMITNRIGWAVISHFEGMHCVLQVVLCLRNPLTGNFYNKLNFWHTIPCPHAQQAILSYLLHPCAIRTQKGRSQLHPVGLHYEAES